MKRLLVLGTVAGLFALQGCVDNEAEVTPKTTITSSSGTTTNTGVGVNSVVSTYEDLTSLPPDTGGQHVAKLKGTTTAAFGYYIYLPAGYNTNTKSYPLLVFLHGKGERGNGTTDLGRVLNTGIPNLIKNNQWKGKTKYPMIVVSPQYHPVDGKGADNNWGEYHPEELKGFIEHVVNTYRINNKRIYLTGLSHGGTGAIDYLMMQDDATSHVAAAVPVAAYGYGTPNITYYKANNTPIWIFVGQSDWSNFTTCTNFITRYNAQIPIPDFKAKYTVYPGVGHESWTRTYNLSGMNTTTNPLYNPYNMSIYDWMFQYKRTAY
ncbi:MAG TPA: alpha/beta hydrolase-fold protein [Ohtaekwangia sp.]